MYYTFTVNDYFIPPFVSGCAKDYADTLGNIEQLVDILRLNDIASAKPPYNKEASNAEVISAFDNFKSGKSSRYMGYYIDTDLIGRAAEVAGSRSLHATADDILVDFENTWGSKTQFRAEKVYSDYIWLAYKGKFGRFAKHCFLNLQMKSIFDEWDDMEGGFWGFPHMIASRDLPLSTSFVVYSSLYICEQEFETEKDALSDMENFEPCRVFDKFFEDIVGDG